VATQHVVKTSGPVEVAFSCGACGFSARALVEGRSTGTATSFLILDRRRARAAAADEAEAEVRYDAQMTASIAPCPRCGKRSRTAAASFVVRSALVATGFLALGAACWWMIASWYSWLVLAVFVAAAGSAVKQRRLRYTLAATRLRDVRADIVLPRAEVRSLPPPPVPRPVVEPVRVEPTPASGEPSTLR
jgi:hypothetical protein